MSPNYDTPAPFYSIIGQEFTIGSVKGEVLDWVYFGNECFAKICVCVEGKKEFFCVPMHSIVKQLGQAGITTWSRPS